MKYILILQ